MKSLEQMRARQAFEFWAGIRQEAARNEPFRRVAQELSYLLMQNGLLATIAYAKSQSTPDRRSLHEQLVLELGKFLAGKERGLLPFPVNVIDDFLRGLTSYPSSLLQQATAEALAYLSYLQRLAPR